ncbi:hypothetical protein ROZALSC1DRAFT_22821 [Rozella allomycis CSF55]|uniref:Uncharacterized protein n=1 Tax=Rozella allomycis (strain CSF55) TaxID=988480 RepID=A0A4P9YH36_ROZAC|nr:hypothetical protein ROZALSC1DRAFT_22821 [Rozella allomycis CSF55]
MLKGFFENEYALATKYCEIEAYLVIRFSTKLQQQHCATVSLPRFLQVHTCAYIISDKVSIILDATIAVFFFTIFGLGNNHSPEIFILVVFGTPRVFCFCAIFFFNLSSDIGGLANQHAMEKFGELFCKIEHRV